MSAAEALKAAHAAGISLRADGGDLLLEAFAPPPAAVLDLLARHKASVISLLRAADEAAFNERAAVLQHDGGLSRWRAELEAAREQGFLTRRVSFCGGRCRLGAVPSRAGGLGALATGPGMHHAGAWSSIANGWALEALCRGWSELEIVGACPVAPWERLD